MCILIILYTFCNWSALCKASAPPPLRQHAFFKNDNFDSLGIMRQLILIAILFVNTRVNSENLCEIAFAEYDDYYDIPNYKKPKEQEEVCKGKKYCILC